MENKIDYAVISTAEYKEMIEKIINYERSSKEYVKSLINSDLKIGNLIETIAKFLFDLDAYEIKQIEVQNSQIVPNTYYEMVKRDLVQHGIKEQELQNTIILKAYDKYLESVVKNNDKKGNISQNN